MTKYEKVKEYLEGLDDYELMIIHNEYTEMSARYDDRIYAMDEFNDVMYGRELFEVARMCYYGSFSPSDDFFWLNGYGNVDSCDYLSHGSPVCIEDIADYIVSEDDPLYNDTIEEILDGSDDDVEYDDDSGFGADDIDTDGLVSYYAEIASGIKVVV